MLVYTGYPWVSPRSIFNGRGYHPPSLVTTICPSQKRSSSLCRLLPSPYSCKISMNFFYPRSCRPSSHPGTPRTIHYGICMPYFCASLDSNVAIPVPLPFPNPFMASWINMDDLWCFFMMVLIILHITSSNPMPLYPPFTFFMRIIVVQVSSAGILPSRNVSWAILTKASIYLSGLFSHVASLSHIFLCSAHIPEGPPALPTWILRTTSSFSSSLGGPSGTTSSCTNTGIVSPYRSCLL